MRIPAKICSLAAMLGVQFVLVYWQSNPLDHSDLFGHAILAFIAALLILLTLHIVITAIIRRQGLEGNWKLSWQKNAIGLLITFVTNAMAAPLFSGVPDAEPRRAARLGKFRNEIMQVEQSIWAAAYAGLCLLWASIGRLLFDASAHPVWWYIVVIASFLGVLGLLPVPDSFGLTLFCWSWKAWIVLEGVMFVFAFFLLPGVLLPATLLISGLLVILIAAFEMLPKVRFS